MPQIIRSRPVKNNPFISNSAKEVFQQNKDGVPKKVEQAQTQSSSQMAPGQTLKLEVFNPKPEQPSVPVMPYQPMVATHMMPGLNPTLQNLFLPTTAFSYGPNMQIPMQKVINITTPGPVGGHVEMRNIYEGILPNKDNRYTFNSIGERKKMSDFVRQVMVRMHDGEDIGLDTDGHNSLMKYIKFMELNPNFYSTINKNPYDGLPYGLLIYRSCFPIRIDKFSRTIQCAKKSIGLNIRLYSLSYAEYYTYKFRQRNYIKYDVWRELLFYEYLREKIVKKYVSPNFPILYTFFTSANQKIDFFKLKRNLLNQKDLLTIEYKKFMEYYNMRDAMISNKTGQSINPDALTEVVTGKMQRADYLPDEVDPVLQKYSGTTLIIITEAPMSNIYQWASMKYEQEGIASKVIENGYHDEKVWINVIFQIMSALAVLQKHGIHIANMTLEDNIYIKDLYAEGSTIGYWIYEIDGVSYYVPNYGYLVLVDSNFKDITPTVRVQERSGREYKIHASTDIFGESVNSSDVFESNYQNYRNIISVNAFSKEHTKNGVMRPPDEVMTFIQDVMNSPEKDIGKIIASKFGRLMNNRIGTFLKKDVETSNIRAVTGDFVKGEMAIQTIDNNTYKWVMVMSEIDSDGNVKIMDRDDVRKNSFYEKTVSKSNLQQYSLSEKIEQNINEPNVIFNEANLIETYIIN